jgi:hypothetical protein
MSDCPSLTLTVAQAPVATLNVAASPSLSFYAANQVPGLSLALTAAETLSDSSFVSITSVGVKMASSFPALPAHAFIRNAAASGSSVYVQVNGLLNGLAGLSVGTPYFLSDVAGGVSVTSPASGTCQRVGTAVATDTILVQIEPPTYLA